MVNIRLATIEDVYNLHNRLRRQDKDEVMALVGLDGKKALEVSFLDSDEVLVAEMNNKIVCMFGICKNKNGGGYPWLLGSDEVNKIPVTFIRESRKYVKQFLDKYGYLENYVDDRNKLSIQWLRWLGFKIEPAKPFGIEQKLFSKFSMGVK